MKESSVDFHHLNMVKQNIFFLFSLHVIGQALQSEFLSHSLSQGQIPLQSEQKNTEQPIYLILLFFILLLLNGPQGILTKLPVPLSLLLGPWLVSLT